MSELKAFEVSGKTLFGRTLTKKVYLKTEADKVIAEPKNRIAPKQSDKTLQERLNEVFEKHGVSTLQDLDWAFCESEKRRSRDNIEAAELLRHQKYKRCMALAEWCDAEADVADADGDYEDMRWYQKWHERWLELAENFKEVK